MWTPLPAYAELHALSNFSFQRGASHAEELVERAQALGYQALAITDECSVAGVVRAHVAAKQHGLKLVPGAEFFVQAGLPFRLVVLAHDACGWGNLCEFITAARQAGDLIEKGSYRVTLGESDFASLTHCEVLLCPLLEEDIDTQALQAHLQWAKKVFSASDGLHCWLAAELHKGLDDALRMVQLQDASVQSGVPLVAAGNVRMHVRSRKPLHDVMTAIRLGRTVHECGFSLQANAEAHLRPRMQLAETYAPGLLHATLEVAARCRFNLDEIRDLYRYPKQDFIATAETPGQCLRRLTAEGACQRYPQGVPDKLQRQLAHELDLIEELHYEMYFITVYDIVRFANERRILCQGRGSAANSAVCYCLGVTAVNPAESQLLFERFISRERLEPPDIDVDFEHQRREEVIQYIYEKCGHDRAAIAATVISYRPRSALRDVGKALGISQELIDHFAKDHFWFDGRGALDEKLKEATAGMALGISPGAVVQWLEMAARLIGFPRHLSQHVGGFVLTQTKLTRLVPVQPASMEARRIIQWDKDDLDAMGLLKVDVLALGMLSAIRRCLQLVDQTRGGELQMHQIESGNVQTYDMICQADTVGVFQIESRAQMSMLPRLKPRCFYDLVVQVAIVRPGPIQGGMVHPYLRRREHPEEEVYPNEELRHALGRTLGVPIFQEQVMQIAMIAADFTPGEADDLRRSMAAWKKKGGVERFHARLVDRMVEKGYETEFAERIFSQIQGFGEYGFPESHAASFAKLVYISCWLKCHEPACFLAAMLNSQPMGFYAPSQLVQDARRHGVEVRPVDVTASFWDCSLEPASGPLESEMQARHPGIREGQPAVRLGLRMVSGLPEKAAERIVQARNEGAFSSTEDMALRSRLDAREINALAAADALLTLAGHRRQQVWEAAALKPAPQLLRAVPTHEAALQLPDTPEGENILFDYQSTGLTLRRHPVALLRPRLARKGLLSAGQLNELPDGRHVAACGIVTVRQQPQTANGTIFLTLEDETGAVNVIVWKSLREQQRGPLLHSRLLAVWGTWQRSEESGGQAKGYGAVRNLVAQRLEDLSPLLGRLGAKSRDFH
ncbi:MAG: error-prone DNA polymerase [Pseudomonadota bacterium]